MAAQAVATLGILTGLWVALSPFFVTLQQGGSNANIADLIAGLAVAAFGAVAVASRHGFGSLQFGTLVLGVWVIISSFILDAKFAIAAPMFWSNTIAGAVLVLLGRLAWPPRAEPPADRMRAGPGPSRPPGPAPRRDGGPQFRSTR